MTSELLIRLGGVIEIRLGALSVSAWTWRGILPCAENNRTASNKIGTGDDDRVKAEVCANPGYWTREVPG